MSDKINCRICDASMHLITPSHLKSHGITLEQYKAQFPGVPTRSIESQKRKEKSAKIANAKRKGIPRSKETIKKIKDTKKNNKHTAWNKGISLSNEQKEKISSTRKEKFKSGKLSHWNTGKTTSEQTKNKISKTLKDKKLTFSDESKEKRKLTMETMYNNGWIHPSLRNDVKDKRRQKNIERYNRDNFSQIHIPKNVLVKLNDKEWLTAEHIDNKKPITTICRELGLHWKNSNNIIKRRLQEFDIEQQYNFSSSYPEKEIQQLLDDMGIEYTKNNRSIISPKELDIFIPSINLAIEYCGLYWHSEQAGKNKHYHKRKYDLCKEKGIQLITIFEDEWIFRNKQVKAKLLSLLNCDNRTKIGARKTQIINVSKTTKSDFFNENHIQGDGPSSINIGLMYENKLVACMGFIKQQDKTYLNRYATSAHVMGGFSKLLKHFKENYNWNELISFADLRWSNGNLYEKTGWNLDKTLDPDYSYSIDKIIRQHKFNFRRKHLPKLLNTFDPNVSEKVNCDNNGVLRIWDCGKQRWTLQNIK